MILAQVVLKILCSQGSIGLQWESRKNFEKGHDSATTTPMGKKKIQVCLYLMVILHIKFQAPTCISKGSLPHASVMDACKAGQTDPQTGPNQYTPSKPKRLMGKRIGGQTTRVWGPNDQG